MNLEIKNKNIDINKSIKKTIPLIINIKLISVFRKAEKYLDNNSVKNLHELRIAVRRLRYIIEVFIGYYKAKFSKSIFKKIISLQDILGKGRDIDVLAEKAEIIEQESGKKLPDFFYASINKEKEIIRQEITTELSKFITDKQINKLLLKKKRG